MKTTLSAFTLSLILLSCNHNDKKVMKQLLVQINTRSPLSRFINPPVKGVDVPFAAFQVDAAKGDTVFYQHRSILLFPRNAFVDKKGNLITGTVQVSYRELNDPVDIYLSGIPMDYDSAGNKYHFESFGMCEMHAYKEGIPVYVNPKSKPTINLVGGSSVCSNLYFLDTVKRNWIPTGTNIVTNLNKIKMKRITPAPADTINGELIAPLKPVQADTKSPIIQLQIDPASFKELKVYNNLKFQLDASVKNFDPNDTAEEWSNVELQKGTGKGLYFVKFSNATRTAAYLVHPVLEGKDYDKALAVFEKNNETYKRAWKQRMANEKADNERNQKEYLRDSLANAIQLAENQRIQQLNRLMEARNQEIEKENKKILNENKITNRENAWIEMRKKKIQEMIKEHASKDSIAQEEWKIQQEKSAKEQASADSIAQEEWKKQQAKNRVELIRSYEDAAGFDTVIRSFVIDGFGVWNCDRIYNSGCHVLTANFTDMGGQSIALTNTTVVWPDIHGLYNFNGNSIEVGVNTNNMIFGVCMGSFAYISPGSYKKLNVTATTQAQTFIMTIVSEKENNYEYIKSLYLK